MAEVNGEYAFPLDTVKLLDHGYIKVIEWWGSDARIVEAARMSTDKGFLGWGPVQCECVLDSPLPGSPLLTDAARKDCTACNGTGLRPGDEKLLQYLYEHWHDTPFEMAGLIIEVQAPIMVFREWHRHRTQSYNELSARYTPLPNFSYVPTVDRMLINAGTSNKQAGTIKGSDALTHGAALSWLEMLEDVYEHIEDVYQSGLAMGVPKELARLPVAVGRYSRMRASANLRNWLAFMTLRSDKNPHAQWEIRQFANVLGVFLKETFPRTFDLFDKGR